ncbi:MAG: HTTM domain-containing protein [Planctomycetota bacterium]
MSGSQNHGAHATRLIVLLRDRLIRGIDHWDGFWFTPRHADTLAFLRIATGAMLLYSHVTLAMDLPAFVGNEALIDNATSKSLQDGTYGSPTAAFSTLWFIDSPGMIALHHGITILVTMLMTVGLLTRVTVPIAVLLQWMLLHRLLGSLFGLDQIVTYCAMYLAITPCGSVFSVDAWLRDRFLNRKESAPAKHSLWLRWLFPTNEATVAANVATRLLQLHLCAIYLFGGLAKTRGQMWWDGTALWYAISNYEYQSIDVTFLSAYPKVFTALTHVAMFWEIFYIALVWPKATRGIVLALAVAVHGGIAAFLGMITFGLMMIAANMIFIDPATIHRWTKKDRHSIS